MRSRAAWVRLGGLNGVCTGLTVQGTVIVCDRLGEGRRSRLFRYPAYSGQDGAALGYAG